MLRFTSEPKKSAKSNISESKTTPIVDNIRTPAPIVDNIQTPPGACPVVSCNYCAPPNPSMAKREHNLKVHIATKHLTSVEFQEDFWISHNWFPCLACKKIYSWSRGHTCPLATVLPLVSDAQKSTFQDATQMEHVQIKVVLPP